MRTRIGTAGNWMVWAGPIVLLLCSVAPVLKAADLQPETLRAWERTVQAAGETLQSRVNSGRFLWIDDQPSLQRAVRRGELKVAPVAAHGAEPVPGGLLHDWVGAAFIPDATLEEVIKVTRDYGRYKEYFNPEVTDSRALSQSGDDDRFSLRLASRVLFVSAGLDTECVARNVRVDDRRFYQISSTTRVQEIQNYGKPSERQLPPDQGDGFIWRLYTITRYQARDGGVYLEIEALALTRDIPGPLRMFVGPVVRRVSMNSLLLSLQQTRQAVLSQRLLLTLTRNNSPGKSAGLTHGY